MAIKTVCFTVLIRGYIVIMVIIFSLFNTNHVTALAQTFFIVPIRNKIQGLLHVNMLFYEDAEVR